MTASAQQIETLAQVLDDAARQARPVPQPSGSVTLDLASAYAVQAALLARRHARGETPAGVKLGFTSRAKAEQMGVHEVILGRLTEAMQVADGGVLDRSALIHPRVEPEVAFLLGAELVPGAEPDALAAAVASVASALEVIDSRYTDFRFSLGDVVADNTSAAAYVIGPWQHPCDLVDRDVRLEVDGELVDTGSTTAILGDPWNALAEAARMAGRLGLRLGAGDVLLAGAATAAAPLTGSGLVTGVVHGLAQVTVRVASGRPRGA